MNAAAPPVIDVHGLNKFFGPRHVVKDLALQVRRGEIFGFLGPNGSGKTTSIRMLCGLLTADSGSGTCLGFDILRESGSIRRHVGYMTQRFSFWEDLTIRENLDFTARVYEVPDRKKTVEQSLEALGLSGRAAQLAGALSGGWKQRLALAACMLHKPDLLLLDEPTAGVDPKARRDFWEELHRLASTGISVLVSTHYMDEAERCHKLAYIAEGTLLAQGTAGEMIAARNLVTFAVTGGDPSALSRALEGVGGIEQTVVFGSTLHVTGKEAEQTAVTLGSVLQQQRAAYPNLIVTPVPTSLEDVFIHMMNGAGNDSRPAGSSESSETEPSKSGTPGPAPSSPGEGGRV